MRAIDSKSFERVGGLDFPTFKGHVKVTLHNVHNGKNEIIEGDNIITNAVKDIFANNYLGAVDYNKLLPLFSKWYGGILCYENQHTTPLSADDYFIKGDDVNPCIAHAGDEAPATQTIVNEDLKRGSPVDVTAGDNSVKFTWGWLPSQGNGQISALSLTHADTGNAGLGCDGSAFKAFRPFDPIVSSALPTALCDTRAVGNAFAQYDDTHTIFFYIGEDEWYDASTVRSGQTKVTVYVRKMAYAKAGLFETTVGRVEFERKFTVTTHKTFYFNPAFYFDATNKKLWLFSNITGIDSYSKTNMDYVVIDCVNGTEDDYGTIISDQSDLTPIVTGGRSSLVGTKNYARAVYNQIVKDGNYVYLPTGTGEAGFDDQRKQNTNGLKKINIVNQSDQTSIPFNRTETFYMSTIKQGGLLMSFNRVCNNGVGYECSSDWAYGVESNLYFNELGKPSSFVCAKSPIENYTTAMNRYIYANKMLNTSLYNLPSAVQKTSSQSMQVEYTLTQI